MFNKSARALARIQEAAIYLQQIKEDAIDDGRPEPALRFEVGADGSIVLIHVTGIRTTRYTVSQEALKTASLNPLVDAIYIACQT
jgi:hypothetical protein